MLNYLRYILATVCFAASVGCLALWWRSFGYQDQFVAYIPFRADRVCFTTLYGSCDLLFEGSDFRFGFRKPWGRMLTQHIDSMGDNSRLSMVAQEGYFGTSYRGFFFPLWYPAVILALAGVAALRLGRRFTLRSAIVAMTIVAVLLGIVIVRVYQPPDPLEALDELPTRGPAAIAPAPTPAPAPSVVPAPVPIPAEPEPDDAN